MEVRRVFSVSDCRPLGSVRLEMSWIVRLLSLVCIAKDTIVDAVEEPEKISVQKILPEVICYGYSTAGTCAT